MSKIDFRNIENLYEQPLPVIKKAVEGKWKLLSFVNNSEVGNFDDPLGTFMHINNNNIIIGDNTQEIIVESQIVWEKQKKFYNGKDVYVLKFNPTSVSFSIQGTTITKCMLTFEIKNDTLSVWNCMMSNDAYFKFYKLN